MWIQSTTSRGGAVLVIRDVKSSAAQLDDEPAQDHTDTPLHDEGRPDPAVPAFRQGITVATACRQVADMPPVLSSMATRCSSIIAGHFRNLFLRPSAVHPLISPPLMRPSCGPATPKVLSAILGESSPSAPQSVGVLRSWSRESATGTKISTASGGPTRRHKSEGTNQHPEELTQPPSQAISRGRTSDSLSMRIA